MATRAEIIDNFFQELDAFPDIPYQPVGEGLVQECESMGPDGLFVSTAAALLEKESGGKNVFGCDFGENFTTVPPYCHVEVTQERVSKLIDNFNQPPAGIGANGVGVTQITDMSLVQEAQGFGGAHIVRNQMRVGFRYLNSLIAFLGWPEGAAAYNAGPGNFLSVLETYGRDMEKKEREWAERLKGASDVTQEPGVGAGVVGGVAPGVEPISLVPAGFVPRAPGELGTGSYIDNHPTRYEWREDVANVIRRLYRRFGSAISVNTYVQHPGDEDGRFARDTAAFDVWGPGGREAADSTFFLDPVLGDQIYHFLFDDLNPPDIDWIIYKQEIWTRETFSKRPFGFDDFTFHNDHIHVTYTGDFELLD